MSVFGVCSFVLRYIILYHKITMLKECPPQFQVQLLIVIQKWFKSLTNIFCSKQIHHLLFDSSSIYIHLQCIHFTPRIDCWGVNAFRNPPPKDLTRTSACDYTTFPTSWRCCLLRLTHLGSKPSVACEAQMVENIYLSIYVINLIYIYMIYVFFIDL